MASSGKAGPHAGLVLASGLTAGMVTGVAGGAVRSLYIHVPFCFHKCHYCDFYSLVDTRDRQEPFARALVRELRALAPWASGEPLRTIFVGGGTPSLLRVPLWREILAALDEAYDLSEIRAGLGEFTVECNPETVSPELMAVLRGGGVDRVSIGAQSFHPRHLKTLERHHDPANVPKALAMAREAGIPRASIDLIFGIPGQTLADWTDDLRRVVDLGLEHASCYNLTYEPNTAMTARLGRGEFVPADEDLELAMFDATRDMLGAAGLVRYEVSNFAKPGRESRHNLAYWRQESWLAAGPSASAHVAGWRWKNLPRLDDYLDRSSPEGFAPVTDIEWPDAARALSERLMTGLRLAEGVDGGEMLARAQGLDPSRRGELEDAWRRLLDAGLVREDGGRWRTTEAGFLLTNRVVGALMDAVRP